MAAVKYALGSCSKGVEFVWVKASESSSQPFAACSLFAATRIAQPPHPACSPPTTMDVALFPMLLLTVVRVYSGVPLTRRPFPPACTLVACCQQVSARWASSSCASRTSSSSPCWPGVGKIWGRRGRRQIRGAGQQHWPTIHMDRWCRRWHGGVQDAARRTAVKPWGEGARAIDPPPLPSLTLTRPSPVLPPCPDSPRRPAHAHACGPTYSACTAPSHRTTPCVSAVATALLNPKPTPQGGGGTFSLLCMPLGICM